MPSLGKNQR